jgi:hypothetical protein
MRTKTYWFLCALLIVCLLGWTGQGQSSRTSGVTWEYKVINTWYMDEAQLNKLGADGWEYVQFDNGERTGNSKVSPRYLFKRAK